MSCQHNARFLPSLATDWLFAVQSDSSRTQGGQRSGRCMNPREFAERVSRGVVLRRRLPRHFHRLPLYVSPEAGLRFWRNDMQKVDPLLFRMVEELVKPGSVVWDVGANVGLFAFGAAALAGVHGFVLAIEPDIW